MKFKQVGFNLRRNDIVFPTYIALTGTEFHRVDAATEKVEVCLNAGNKKQIRIRWSKLSGLSCRSEQ